MPRQKSQRPTVYLAGKREKFWKAEYREYFIGTDGKEHSRHKSITWSREDHTKAEAQDKCDAFMAALRQGGPRADGSMTLAAFYDTIYYPVRSRRWEWNTRHAYGNVWAKHIKPALGGKRLDALSKAVIELHLCALTDAGLSGARVQAVLGRLRDVLEEAADNDYIPKNPAKRIEPPRADAPDSRSLTADEARRLLDTTSGRDYLIWHILLITGPRIGEVLALDRSDLTAEGLRFDQSVANGKRKTTKNRKTRMAPIPDSLRAELEEWLTTHANEIMFPSARGMVQYRKAEAIENIIKRGRELAGIPDLTFRMCRTTFATLFQGDIRDAQEILGHHSEAFTRARYQKSIPERAAAAVAEMDQRLGKVVPIKRKVG